MGKLRVIQNVLNGGELAPRLRGRTNIPRYQNGLEKCSNAIPLVMGGACRRSGFRRVTAAVADESRLYGVVLSTTERYLLEFGDQTLRFILNGTPLTTAGGAPYSISVPYPLAAVDGLTVEQTTDEVYLFHDSYPIHKLTRSGTIWTCTQVDFRGGPFLPKDTTISTTITPSADKGPITLTAASPMFATGDVGGLLRLNYPMDTWGYVRITGYTSATVVAAQVLRVLGENYISNPAFDESMLGWSDCSTGAAAVIYDGASGRVTLDATGVGGKARIEYETSVAPARSYTVSVNVIQAPVILQVGRADNKKVYKDVTFDTTGVQTATITLDAAQPGRVYVCLETDYYYIENPDWAPGTTISEPRTGIVDDITLKGSNQLQTMDWAWGAWSPKNGYPCTGVFAEQRLWAASSIAAPTTIWGSRINKLADFEVDDEADAAVSFIPAQLTTRINHLVAADNLFAFGFNRIVTLAGGDTAISATNVDIKQRARHTCSALLRPVQIGNQYHFSSSTGKRFRALKFSLEESAYNAPDLALYSEHLIQPAGGIVAAAFTAEPESVLWCVTAAGGLISLTIDNDQQVAAWAAHPGPDLYRSVAVIPDEYGEDQLWAVVSRWIGGTLQTGIEVMQPGLYLDAATLATAATPATTVTGLEYLEGEEVAILADGYVHPSRTVAGGQITLDYPASTVAVGLPYTTLLRDLPLEVSAGEGVTVQGSNIQVASVRVRLHETAGASINGEVVPYQSFGDNLLDVPMALFSGDKEVDRLGRGSEPEESQVEIIQELPLPLTVLAIIKEVAING